MYVKSGLVIFDSSSHAVSKVTKHYLTFVKRFFISIHAQMSDHLYQSWFFPYVGVLMTKDIVCSQSILVQVVNAL